MKYLSLALMMFTNSEAFESKTSSDWINDTVWPIRHKISGIGRKGQRNLPRTVGEHGPMPTLTFDIQVSSKHLLSHRN